MKRTMLIMVAIILAVLILAIIATKNMARKVQQADSSAASQAEPAPAPQSADSAPIAAADRGATPAPKGNLPRLLDLGADKCIPCKMMAPILDQLRKEYAGTFAVEFIDVWKNPDAVKKHGVLMIPTQIFYDAAGTEQFRHEGFFSRADILKKWQELGVNVAAPNTTPSN